MAFQVKKFDSIVASMVNWISSNTSKVTDFNVGSVIRTILEAIAMELEELYYQLMKAVEEAIEEAIYRAFNFPKNPAERATGSARFFRLRGTDVPVSIPKLSIVSTDTSPAIIFEVQSDSVVAAINNYATDGGTVSLVDSTRNWAAEGVVLGSKVRNITDNGETQPAGVLSITTTVNPNDTLNFSVLTNGASFVVDIATFDKVYYSDNGVVTDITSAASGVGTYFPVGLVVNQDYIYCGSDGMFFSMVFNKGATVNVQDIVANLVIEYWNGTAWISVSNLINYTSGGTGKPFSANGNINWDLSGDWQKSTYQSQYKYWVRLSTNTTLTATAEGDYLWLRRGDEYEVIAPYRDVAVQALAAGIGGNVKANSVIVLRSNLPNVESVTNIAAFSNGKEEETDLERKARFSLYIQSLARATRGALEYAARIVEQVVAAKAVDDVRATVLKQDYGPPSVWTDITPQMRNPGDAAVPLFEEAEAQNDALYIGASELFNYINMHLTTPGVVAANNLIWEYYSTTGWKTLPGMPSGDGTDSGTGPLQQSGSISFVPPSDWVALALPPIGAAIYSYTRLWIRLRITASGVAYSTTPTGDYCSLPPGFGYVYLYCHDGSGELSNTLKASVENAVEPYRGCGIVVEIKAPNLIYPTVVVSLLIAANYDAGDVANKVKQALIDYLNTKVLGEDLYVAELYQFVMDKYDKAILNMSLSIPVQDIIVPSSEVIRPNPLLITVTGTTV